MSLKPVKDLRIGTVYFVSGQGPMELIELPDLSPKQSRIGSPSKHVKTTVTLLTPYGCRYYAMPSELLEATLGALETFRDEFACRFSAPLAIQTITAWIAKKWGEKGL